MSRQKRGPLARGGTGATALISAPSSSTTQAASASAVGTVSIEGLLHEAGIIGGEEHHKWLAIVTGGDDHEADDTEIASFQGMYRPWYKVLLYCLLAVLTCGMSLLLSKWAPKVYMALALSACDLRDATHVRITLMDGRVDLEPVITLSPEDDEDDAEGDDQEGHASGSNAAGDEDAADVEQQRSTGSGLRQPLLAPASSAAPKQQQRRQQPHELRMLEYRCSRYVFSERQRTYALVPPVPKGFNTDLQRVALQLMLHQELSAISHDRPWDAQDRAMRYGSNEMSIPIKSIPAIIFEDMWHPFYVAQYCSIAIWVFGDQYYSYSVCIAIITWFSIISSAVETHANMARLAAIARSHSEVEVLRDGSFIRVPSSALVPGDVFRVTPGSLPCDAVLLAGEAIVDENMLTGESVPVRKITYSPVADGLSYSPDKSTACTLYGGTMVAQARAVRGKAVLAMAVRTRFYSSKGQLLRSILFPREHEEAFVSDSLVFIAIMLVGCMGLYAWAASLLAGLGASWGRIAVRGLDMITIAVPPALPACLTIATVFSISRLRKRDVFVTSPDRIAMGGQLDVVAFDKTGTLTEQGLDLWGIVPVGPAPPAPAPNCAASASGSDQQAAAAAAAASRPAHKLPAFEPPVTDAQALPASLQALLASCHGLAHMGAALVGDPLDQRLFLATGWTLLDARHTDHGAGAQHPAEEEHAPPAAAPAGGGVSALTTIPSGSCGALDAAESAAAAAAGAALSDDGCSSQQQQPHHHTCVVPPGAPLSQAVVIVKRFEFNAALQRNVVVARTPAGKLLVMAKGSPEMIRTLVNPGGVPDDFDTVLSGYTREGLRVLALAQGEVPGGELVTDAAVGGWRQEEAEGASPLRLVGLAVMANPLREDSPGVVAQLQAAQIRTLMVTGDHVRTAISVAHQCHITPEGRAVCLVDAADAASASASSATVASDHCGGGDAAAGGARAMPGHGHGHHGHALPHSMPALMQQPESSIAAADAAAGTDAGAGAAGGDEGCDDSDDVCSTASAPQLHPRHPHLHPNHPHPSATRGDPADEACGALVGSEPLANRFNHPNHQHHSSGIPGGAGEALVKLSLLHPDGSVEEVGPRSRGALAARLLAGEMECAVTGKGFDRLVARPDAVLFPAVLRTASVYARMSPDNKRDLMELLGSGSPVLPHCQHLGLHVGFVGDGANDCGALKAAHVGVSLCEAEASVAAPLTSKNQTIASMVSVVAEGRCMLMTTHQIFQFIIGYALVQAFQTNLMYCFALNVGNYQFLVEDLFFTTVLAALMGRTGPRAELATRKPASRVMSTPLLVSTCAQLAVVIAFQLAALAALAAQPGYVPTQGPKDLRLAQAPENSVTYIVALSQFITLALVFNKGRPHRAPITSNWSLLIALAAQVCFVAFSLFVPSSPFNTQVQQLVDEDSYGGIMSTAFRLQLAGLMLVNAVVAIAVETIVQGLVLPALGYCCGAGRGDDKRS